MPSPITGDAAITKRGTDLASALDDRVGFGTTDEILRTCSLIARHATTYERIQERWTNEEMTDRVVTYWEERESALERRITRLVEWLPETDDGPIRVQFQGDPRGACVALVLPDGRTLAAEAF